MTFRFTSDVREVDKGLKYKSSHTTYYKPFDIFLPQRFTPPIPLVLGKIIWLRGIFKIPMCSFPPLPFRPNFKNSRRWKTLQL